MAPEEPVNLRAFVEAVPGLMTSHFESVLASQRRSITSTLTPSSANVSIAIITSRRFIPWLTHLIAAV
ncbi:hypothetical protein E4U44_005428 [Claviceps purpurea]|nr:hypothetical protein E4U44_005428 [Claviceps purpurea]